MPRQKTSPKINALYARVSKCDQHTENQLPDLQAFAAHNPEPHQLYEDHFTGRSMDRPGWQQLLARVRARQVKRLVVWRLDRLGRTVGELVQLFEELDGLGVELISLHDGIAGNTLAGRLVRTILAAVASFELELMRERVRAGQDRARAAGKKWGGSKKGRELKVSAETRALIIDLAGRGWKKTDIARRLHLHRATVYRVLAEAGEPGGEPHPPGSARR